jgi:regulator of replication initiation timing
MPAARIVPLARKTARGGDAKPVSLLGGSDMPKIATPADFESIDRLEEKVKLLVAMIGRLRTEQARVAEENMRLSRELEQARVRIAEHDGAAAEVTALRGERDLVRTRVQEMLEQLEGLNL